MPSFKSYFLEKVIKLTAKSVGGKSLEKRGIAERRQKLDAASKRLRMPENCLVEPLQIEGIYAEWLSYRDSPDDKVILYLHGGGYGYCSVQTHRTLAAGIGKAAGVKVIIPAYRLAPEHPFPAAIEDAVRVYRWLLEQGFHSSQIIFAGDSAGGGLSIATALVLRDQNEPLPAALVCLSPWVDLTSSGQSYQRNGSVDPYLNVDGVRKTARMYAGEEALDHPLISPVFADLAGLPPLFIQVGSHEILQSDAEMLAAAARHAGITVKLKVWNGMWHVWQMSGDFIPEARRAIKEIGDFVKRTFRG
ncbi:alpha/beta hydrolase [Neobacillus sp. NPDC058068]|uniref:alpha/beta hydrolase n=1 Tax=Neobacillus sp. NPDC058068 TaxID=3346325 RepID=UPI0036D7AFAD